MKHLLCVRYGSRYMEDTKMHKCFNLYLWKSDFKKDMNAIYNFAFIFARLVALLCRMECNTGPLIR